MIPVWLALDPETRRVSIQDREPDDGSFPRGPRGLGWEVRQAYLDEETWRDLLAGRFDAGSQDDLHRTLWTQNGDTPWLT